MTFIFVALSTFWIWEFLYVYTPRLPDYVTYFLVPAIACGLWLLPHLALSCLAVSAVVGLLHRATHRLFNIAARQAPKRRASLPPLP